MIQETEVDYKDTRSIPGLRTRSIFNRVEVQVQEIFASPSSSSGSKNFIFRVRVRQK